MSINYYSYPRDPEWQGPQGNFTVMSRYQRCLVASARPRSTICMRAPDAPLEARTPPQEKESGSAGGGEDAGEGAGYYSTVELAAECGAEASPWSALFRALYFHLQVVIFALLDPGVDYTKLNYIHRRVFDCPTIRRIHLYTSTLLSLPRRTRSGSISTSFLTFPASFLIHNLLPANNTTPSSTQSVPWIWIWIFPLVADVFVFARAHGRGRCGRHFTSPYTPRFPLLLFGGGGDSLLVSADPHPHCMNAPARVQGSTFRRWAAWPSASTSASASTRAGSWVEAQCTAERALCMVCCATAGGGRGVSPGPEDAVALWLPRLVLVFNLSPSQSKGSNAPPLRFDTIRCPDIPMPMRSPTAGIGAGAGAEARVDFASCMSCISRVS
ncbi:hypothetical protein K438DRAFT_1972538 [Mycena galopus ATCC 62051]|nr:hypothetical protein K438DRAFT_1972538 [Mycena galopus ATCC 62051]